MVLEIENMEHTFSVELNSKSYVRNVSISNSTRDRVLFEGNLGKLMTLSFVEGDILELVCENGCLRIDLSVVQMKKVIEAKSKSSLSAEEGVL